MTTLNITKEELNKAIYEVVTNQFKKNCPESHEKVKTAGYEIAKWNGVFHVKNANTNRVLCMSVNKYNYKRSISYNPYRRMSPLTDKFDFVGCLNKPINQNTIDEYNAGYDRDRNSVQKYETLRRRRRDIKYHEECIEDAKKALQKALERYEWDIAYHIKALDQAKKSYSDYRKEINLTA